MPRPRKFDEQQVLTAARNAFWRDGYAATSVHELTEATGLGTQSLYGAFGSKHDLFLRILDEYCADQAAGLQAAVNADPSPWHSLTAAVTYEDGGRLRLPEQGCLMANSIAELSATDEQVRSRSCQVHAATIELFTRQVVAAQEGGEIDRDLDPEQTARALFAVMQGIEFLHKAGIGAEEVGRAKTAVLGLVDRAVTRSGDADGIRP